MKGFEDSNICPRCDSPALRSWGELADQEKYIVERLPIFADVPEQQRKKHRFCTRCWFEETTDGTHLA